MRIGCIVLAAGRSTRFGENKLIKDLCGAPVLAWTLRALPLDRLDACVCVCASAEAERISLDCGVPVRRYAGGTLSDSIREGLAALPKCDGILFVNGDQPLLTRESLIRLIEALAAEPDAVCRLACGETMASPALFPASLRSALEDLRGERGGMSAATSARVLPVQAVSPEELWDTDDPAALAEAEGRLARRLGII